MPHIKLAYNLLLKKKMKEVEPKGTPRILMSSRGQQNLVGRMNQEVSWMKPKPNICRVKLTSPQKPIRKQNDQTRGKQDGQG